jgi:hypothetical protein
MSVWTYCHDVRMGATLNRSNLLDADGRLDACLSLSDGSLGSDFSNLESEQNLLRAS